MLWMWHLWKILPNYIIWKSWEHPSGAVVGDVWDTCGFLLHVPSLKLTASLHLKIDPWERRFLLETTIFRGYVSFWGVYSLRFITMTMDPLPVSLWHFPFKTQDVSLVRAWPKQWHKLLSFIAWLGTLELSSQKASVRTGIIKLPILGYQTMQIYGTVVGFALQNALFGLVIQWPLEKVWLLVATIAIGSISLLKVIPARSKLLNSSGMK